MNFLFSFALGRLDAHLFIILFKRCQVLARFGKFSFLHSLANVPMHKSTLAVHEVELVVDA